MAKQTSINIVATLHKDGIWHVGISSPPAGVDAASLIDGMVLVMANLAESCEQVIAACIDDSSRETRMRMVMEKLGAQLAEGAVESESKVRRVE